MQAKALWHLSPTQSVLDVQNLAPLDANQILIKSQFSLISTGTEQLVATGSVPPSMHDYMRVQGMEGNFNFPIKYGYSLVGQVVSEGSLQGRLVHLMHPHQDKIFANQEEISFVPEGISPKVACLASNMETAINALWDSEVSLGDKVLVCGFGMIGGLVARLLSFMPAVDLYIRETNPNRAAIAQKMGFKLADDMEGKFDYSFHTSGTATGLQYCIDILEKEGKVVELSWYGRKEINLSLGGDFHFLRKQIISSQVAHIPAKKSARWNYKRRKELVWNLLGKSVFADHISDEISFKDSPVFFDKLRNKELFKEGIGWVIKY